MTPRPRNFRYCRPYAGDGFFKPKGIPLTDLEVTELAHDELEALRLCDFEEKEQEQAAKSMSISRQTLQRLLYAGRKKVADALLNAKAIKVIGGGHIIQQPIPFGGGCGHRMRHRYRD